VPADGFYEWQRLDEKTKQPFAFRMKDDAPFAFAGLWDAWKAPDGSWLQSFSIITTDANELMAKVHTRMPVILHPSDYDRWLERESEHPPTDLLKPYEAEEMAAARCNKGVGNARNNGPEMLMSSLRVILRSSSRFQSQLVPFDRVGARHDHRDRQGLILVVFLVRGRMVRIARVREAVSSLSPSANLNVKFGGRW
jgi:hypothetical protein